MAPVSEADVVQAGGRIDTIQWVVGEFFPIFLAWESSEVTYYDVELRLEAECTWSGINHVRLFRYFLTPDSRASVYFSIRCKTSDGVVRDVAVEQTIPQDSTWWELYFDPPFKIPFMSRITLLCSLWRVESPPAAGPLCLCEPRVPPVDRPLLPCNPESVECSTSPTGEVKEVNSDGRTATFEWKIPDLSQPEGGFSWSPPVTYFNMKLSLGIRSTQNGVDCVSLGRDRSSPGFEGSVRFSIQCRTSDGEERDIVREQEIPEDSVVWEIRIDPPWRIPPSVGATLTCLLWKEDSSEAPGISQETQPKVALNQNDEHPLKDMENLRQKFRLWLQQPQEGDLIRILRPEHFQKRTPEGGPSSRENEMAAEETDRHFFRESCISGFSQETQTEDGAGRSNERRSEDMEKLRQKFRLWLQQPQEGDCIRILRPEHFQERIPEGGPSCRENEMAQEMVC